VSVVLAYIGFFVIPFLLTLPVVLPLASTHKNVYRIVFFRKFNTSSNRHIRRYIRKVIGQYGHVFTLSDRMFKVKWYVRIPLFLGQFSFFHFRLATIRSSKGIDRLHTLLHHKGKLNVNWYLSRSKIFAIKTTDEYWKQTAKVLLEDANLVLFEITELTEALDWEVNTVVASGQGKKVIFTANPKYKSLAEEWKAKCDPIMGEPIPLIIYDHTQQKESEQALHTAIQNELVSQPLGDSASLAENIFKTVIPRASGVVLLACVALLFISPYLFPRFAAKYSPIYNQAYTGYIYTYMRDTTNIQTAEVLRLKERWGNRTVERLIEEAWDHPKYRCVAILKGLDDFQDSAYYDEYLKLAHEAEPDVSEAAFRVIEGRMDERGVESALKFLDNGRTDHQFRALELLTGETLDVQDAREILEVVSAAEFTSATYPFQHNNSRRGRGELAAAMMERLVNSLSLAKTDTSFVFYSGLKNVLSQPLATMSLQEVKEWYETTENPHVKYLLSYTLLEKGSGDGLLTFFDPGFMDSYYFFGYGLFDIHTPYRTAFKDITRGRGSLRDLPTTDELLAVAKRAEDSLPVMPYPLVDFLLVNFGNLSVETLGYPVEPGDVYEGLYRMMDQVKGNQARRTRIAPHKEFVELYLDEEELEDRLEVARLLAYLGDARILPILKEAEEYNRPTLLFSNLYVYPFRDDAEEIRRIYNWGNR